MKFFSLAVLVCCPMLAALASHAQDNPAPTDVSGNIDWVFDLAEGQKIGLETAKPLFIVFRCER